MRWHLMLIVYQIWFVSTASLGGRLIMTRLPTIHCALLRKPPKGPNCNGMHGELSTKSQLIVAVPAANHVGLNMWERQIPS